ncbi:MULTISPECIES: peptidase [unclassified Polaromonas]|jgi:hypothetical protein|nr:MULTISPECIES: peptidase [unclassified Polaromonas]
MEGIVVDFTSSILEEVASTYDPKLHEAPIVIGHPKLADPAYGWVGSLSFGEGGLVADERQVDPDFNELRRKGHYKHPSASFYMPDSPNNPTPGKWYLRHVGFLGATAPALKGLNAQAVSFAESEQGVVTFGELPGYAGSYVASMLRKLREWFIDKEGLETADRILPDWEVEGLREISQRASDSPTQATPQITSFADPSNPLFNHKEPPSMDKTPEQLKKELTEAQGTISSLQEADRKRAADGRHAAHVSFADTLIAEARWPSGAKDVLVATLDHLQTPSGEAGVVSFGEGDKASPLAVALQEQLKALSPMVELGEVATKAKGAGAATGGVVSFAEQPGYAGIQVDPVRADLDKRIKAHMAEHKVDYATAASQLTN